ncbi:hypothetical protein NDU88_011258 [Pleurodeles waltl]|uniref:Uncharacterized protein n=1 Tax=Pleurodeles waltl TaxID=8319 RepID=A0AAV7PX78_PLEWA|nr:hypothetical protein NDU88_011258 [Pleurodeles waltl]
MKTVCSADEEVVVGFSDVNGGMAVDGRIVVTVIDDKVWEMFNINDLTVNATDEDVVIVVKEKVVHSMEPVLVVELSTTRL